MLRATDMKYKSTSEIKYRYACKQCGCTTEWFEYSLSKVEIHRVKSTRLGVRFVHDINELIETETKALKQLCKFISLLQKYLAAPNPNVMPDYSIFEQLASLFSHGKSCPQCKSRQPWYAAVFSRRLPNNFDGLEVIWGEPTVELLGKPDESEYIVNAEDVLHKFSKIIISKPNTRKEDFGYWYLSEMAHDNILYVQSVIDYEYGVFSVSIEDYEGVPLSQLLLKGIAERDFQDYILQLCDALEFLHTNKPSLTHNAVVADNILVGKNNHLKLTHFNEVTVGNSPSNDIYMVGKLMSGTKSKYIKKYQHIIENCIGKEYMTIADFKSDFLTISTQKFPKVVMLLFVLFTMAALLARRLL